MKTRGRPLIVVAGDAQARGLALLFGALPALKAKYDVGFFEPGLKGGSFSGQDVQRCAFFLQQTNAGSGADYGSFRRAKRITFPALRFDLLWPLACANPYNEATAERPMGNYPYGDSFVIASAEQGVQPDDIMRLLLAPKWNASWPDLDAFFSRETARLLSADAKADVKVGSYILKHFRRTRLFWAPTAPANVLLAEVGYRILHACLGADNAVERSEISAHLAKMSIRDVMSHVAVPVHPVVAKHFGLEWYDPAEKYQYFNEERTFHEYFGGLIESVKAQRAEKGTAQGAVR